MVILWISASHVFSCVLPKWYQIKKLYNMHYIFVPPSCCLTCCLNQILVLNVLLPCTLVTFVLHQTTWSMWLLVNLHQITLIEHFPTLFTFKNLALWLSFGNSMCSHCKSPPFTTLCSWNIICNANRRDKNFCHQYFLSSTYLIGTFLPLVSVINIFLSSTY